MNCDSCRSDIGVRRIENNIMLCAYCRYDPKKYEDVVVVKATKRKRIKKDSPKVLNYKKEYAKTGCCFYCKTKLPYDQITIDHFRPRSHGGKNEGNRLFCCSFCNTTKSSFSIDEFRDKLMRKYKHSFRRKLETKQIEQAINTCSLILNNFIKPPLF